MQQKRVNYSISKMAKHTPDIDLLRKGDKKEFENIYFEYVGVLYALCYQYTRSHAVAQENVQDSYLKLWELRTFLKPDTNIKNLLYTIARNKCLNHLRNEQIAARHLNNIRFREAKYAEEALAGAGESYIEFAELRGKIGEAIAALPPDLREVFEMNRFDGLTYKEISLKLNLSEKTIEARMSKALKILKGNLKGYFPIWFLLLASSYSS